MIDSKIKKAISKAFEELFTHNIPPDLIPLQPTRKEFEGHYTFIIFPYLNITKYSPEESGRRIGEKLKSNTEFVDSYNVVKGFLNLTLTNNSWTQTLHQISNRPMLGTLPTNGQKILIEFSSPNTNKPLHLGHLRNNFLGDAMTRILEANGYDIQKVHLVNDRGIHICKSMLAYLRFGNDETPESSGLKGDYLIGKYYVKFDQQHKKEIEFLVENGMDAEQAKKEAPSMKEAQELLQKWEDGDKTTVALWKKMNKWVYQGFDVTYNTMGIHFDKMYKESETYLLGKNIVAEGLEKGVFFKKKDGSVWVDLTDEGLDQKLLLRADGTSVYITQDLGTTEIKYREYPFDQSVFVVGNEQDYHFKVLFAIMSKLGKTYADGLYHLSYGMVDLPSGKMKSREGTVVDADNLLHQMFETAEKHTMKLGKLEGMDDHEARKLYKILGLGALKYFLLKVDPKKRILFKPQESIEFQGHTGPFIQYTHARIVAILRRASSLGTKQDFDPQKVGALNNREIDLVRKILDYNVVLKEAGKELSPAIIAQYVFELAKEYNGFYQEVSIFGEENNDKLRFRIVLSSAIAKSIKKCMSLLGIEVPDRM